VSAAQIAVQSQIDSKLDVNGKAVSAGNADTVNNHTVLSDVPAGAVFTDTTYQQMTDQEAEDGVEINGKLISAHTLATFVLAVIADVINSAPQALDTLGELAAALGDDPNFATTVTNMISQKLDKAGGTISGDLNVTGTMTAASLVGALTGNVTGNVSGSAGSATNDKNGDDITTTYMKLTGGTVSGNLVVTGNITGDVVGNAATATKIHNQTVPVVASFDSVTGALALTGLS
jgi:hypothetical protein